MTAAAALAALCLAAAPAAEPGAVPRPEATPSARPAHRGVGAVSYVTAAGRAYLDAGADDGLAAGTTLALRRDGEPAGSCTVEAIAPHHAVCAGGHPRAGDTFALPAVAAPAPPRQLPPPPTQDVLARRWAVVNGARMSPVPFRGSSAEAAPLVMPRTRAIDVSLTHQTWDVNPGGASSKESLDVLARGVPLASWLFLDVDARLEHWMSRQNARFRPKDKTQLYVWQAQLTAVPSDALSLSAGRVLPWGVPGATILDGGMVSLHGRLGEARAEGGLFGGIVPQPDTLGIDTQRATGGVYWIVDRQVGGLVLRTEGRLAAVRSPELGTRGEASLTGRAFLKQADLSAEANLGAGGKIHATGYLDSARLDATVRPAAGLSLGGSLRYAGLAWPQSFEPAAFPGRTRAGDAFVSWDVLRWLRVGAVGGVSSETGGGASHSWIGPELALPQIFGRWGTLSGGYLEERGWIGGRSAYAQWVAQPWKPLSLLTRVAWAHDDVDGLYRDEASMTLGARAELGQFFALRLTVSGRTGLDASGEEGGHPSGLTAFATLQASY